MSDSEFELEFSEDESLQQQALEDAHIKIKNEQDRAKEEQQLEQVQAERRLTSIKESYQRYLCLQRLDEINLFALGLLKEQLGLIGVAVDSVMGTFELGCRVEIEKLIQFVPNAKLKRYNRSVVGVELNHPSVNMGVTASGSVTIMGAKTTSQAYLAARRLACIINTHLNPNAKVTKFNIRNIVMQVVYPEDIDLAGLEQALKRVDVDCYKPPAWACLQVKFNNKDLPLVQPEMPANFNKGPTVTSGDGTGASTLTGGFTGVKQDMNMGSGQQQQLPHPSSTNANSVKAEMGNDTTTTTPTAPPTTMNDGEDGSNGGQNVPNQESILPTQYPPEFDYRFSAKIFGSGSIIIMGFKSIAMGVLAAQIVTGMVKKYNQKFSFTQSVRFGQFVSRNVNIAEANSLAATIAMTGRGGKSFGNDGGAAKRQKGNSGAKVRKARRGDSDDSDWDDGDSDQYDD